MIIDRGNLDVEEIEGLKKREVKASEILQSEKHFVTEVGGKFIMDFLPWSRNDGSESESDEHCENNQSCDL